MAPASPTPEERARKANSIVLQRLSPDGTQRKLAEVLNVSESTVSRWKQDAEHVLRMCAYLDLKVVDAGRECIPHFEAAMLRRVYAKVSEHAPWLLNEDEV